MVDSPIQTGTLIVSRRAHKDIKMRDLYVLVDGEEADTLQFGETMEMDLPPGDHRVKVTNRMLSKSSEFSISAGEKVEFEVGNVPSYSPFTIVMLITGTMPYRVMIRRKN